MPSGDNVKVWFPEMLDELQKMWRPDMTWSEVSQVCLHMGERLRRIREDKSINTNTGQKCACGGSMVLTSRISIRSLLFSLKKIEAISVEEFDRLDKEWMRYQRKHKLTAYHEPKEP